MTDIDNGLKDVAEIRSMMERSTKFLSLSGLSGIAAGIVALAGWWWASSYLGTRFAPGTEAAVNHRDVLWFMLASGLVIVGALAASMFFSWRLARRKGLPVWNVTARDVVAALIVPLASGGVFCVILVRESLYALVPSAMLVFYGVALVSAGKYTMHDIRFLGLSEIVLGLLAGLFPEAGLLLWATGFGVLHIAYGIVMFLRYEK